VTGLQIAETDLKRLSDFAVQSEANEVEREKIAAQVQIANSQISAQKQMLQMQLDQNAYQFDQSWAHTMDMYLQQIGLG
jgi:hypothetical protein